MKILFGFFEFLIDVVGFILAKIPHCLFYGVIKALASLLRFLDKKRYKNARANLDFVFGDTYTTEQKKQIIKRCYENFVFVILESIRLPFLNKDAYLKRFDFQGKDNLFSLLKENKKVVLVSAHYGYWESLGTAIPLQMQKELQNYKNYDMFSLGRLTNFDFINQMIIKRREIFNVRLIDKKGAFRKLLKIYSASNAVGTGILIDQNMSKDEGIEIDFLAKKATQTPITSILSRRFDVYLVPILIDFNKDYSKYTMHIYPSIQTPQTSNMQQDILEATIAQVKIIENAIKTNPSNWFWFHKRFKSFYPEIYSKTNH
ncbi:MULTISPECIES: lipid A biosynthesis lauroyl acyltransferase [unclassified Helicobacter]|uniref:lipid A biosynthesis lauroyl acyltransferase n=1 Tax=unclassified Helicobacter TaxID=2593540 RepID=UPI000CF1527F|nr:MULTISPECIES: lipid A biosynthesis lauroyl acyltransferase [unclassified Helicobacter]